MHRRKLLKPNETYFPVRVLPTEKLFLTVNRQKKIEFLYRASSIGYFLSVHLRKNIFCQESNFFVGFCTHRGILASSSGELHRDSKEEDVTAVLLVVGEITGMCINNGCNDGEE